MELLKNNKLNIAVLMSTFNGEEYIKEQISSILRQKYVGLEFDLDIFVRDDGSSDSTIDILKSMNMEHKINIIDNNGINLGPKMSFFTLLKDIEGYDLYFFSDQDDVWPANKVIFFINEYKELSKNEVTLPIGIYSDLYIADAFGNPIGKTMSDVYKWDPSVSFKTLVWNYRITGAAFAINDIAVNVLKKIDNDLFQKVNMHDSFIGLVIAIKGKIVQINEPLLYYRQHNNNVIGSSNKKRSVLWRIRKLFDAGKNLLNDAIVASKIYTDKQNNVNIAYLQTVIKIKESRFFIIRLFNYFKVVKDISVLKYKFAVLLSIIKK